MIKTIFVDLDDVLNVFTMHALKWVGCDGTQGYNPEWGWDIVRAANALHPTRAFTPNQFWRALGRDCWSSAPKSEICDGLLNACADYVGRENVCILSSVTIDPECVAGKHEWVLSHLPRWMHRQFLFGTKKDVCAHPEALLIDDCDSNIVKFRAAGGHTITVPRPWNCLNAYGTQNYVEATLREIMT